jgi:UDP-glucose 4-epimerase
MSKYLVTGGAGFIGSNLARYILEQGHDVVILDDLSTGKSENISDLADVAKFIKGDIRDRATVDKAIKGCKAVFHEAARASVPRSVADPVSCHDVNVNGTFNVLEAARAAGVKRVVFAGSSSAYGDQPVSPKREDMPPLPISPYAASKVAGEVYMRAYSGVFGLETLTLRYFNVFGPYQDPAGAYAAVIPAWVSRLLKGEKPVVYGDGEQSRDFCYIENVCRANWLAANCPAAKADGSVVNIACNRATSLNQILAKLRELLGTKTEAVYTDPRPGDVKDSLADISRAKEVIGYEPKIFFEEGLTKAIDWYKANLG